MPRITPAHRLARREQIARAAVEQFAQHGIHSTSMANIIRASGLSSGAIYTHFESKAEIIAFVAQGTFDAMFSGVEVASQLSPPPAPDELLSMITARIRGAPFPVGLLVQVWAEAVTNPVVRETVNAVYHRAFEVLEGYAERWLRDAHRPGAGVAPEAAAGLAGRMISQFYARILQLSLINNYDPDSLGIAEELIEGDATP